MFKMLQAPLRFPLPGCLKVTVHLAHFLSHLYEEITYLKHLQPLSIATVMMLLLHYLRKLPARHEFQHCLADSFEGTCARIIVAFEPMLGDLLGQIYQSKPLV
jgi:hypothetical protein